MERGRTGPKSKKAGPKSKKVEEKEPEVIEIEEEPPTKKGKGLPKVPAKNTTQAKNAGRSTFRARKTPAKKVEQSESKEEAEYEVHSILKERNRKGVMEYKVRWKGYSAKSATWEPAKNLGCTDAIDKYKKKKEEAKNAPTKSLREAPKKAERSADVAGHGGEHRLGGSKQGAGAVENRPRNSLNWPTSTQPLDPDEQYDRLWDYVLTILGQKDCRCFSSLSS